MKELEPYKKLLIEPLTTADKLLVFKFEFTRSTNGIVHIEDKSNNKKYNAFFGLVMNGEDCFLKIILKDLYIDTFGMEINEEINSLIEFIIKKLKSFKRESQ